MKYLEILAAAALANAAVLRMSNPRRYSNCLLKPIGLTFPHAEKRQFADLMFEYALGKPMAPILRRDLKPELNTAAKRELLVWGPFKLIAANVNPGSFLLSYCSVLSY
jgi:hypothetical protein